MGDIKKVLKERGWSLTRLAKVMTAKGGASKGQIGMSEAALSLILSKPKVDYRRLEEIARITGIPIEDLTGEREPNNAIICPHCGQVINLNPE